MRVHAFMMAVRKLYLFIPLPSCYVCTILSCSGPLPRFRFFFFFAFRNQGGNKDERN